MNLFWSKFWWLQFLFLCCLICCRFFSHSKSASRQWNCTVCCFGSMFNMHVIHVYKIAYPLQPFDYLANSVYVWCVSDIGCDKSTSEKRNALSCVTTCVPSTQYNVIHFIDGSGWNTQQKCTWKTTCRLMKQWIQEEAHFLNYTLYLAVSTITTYRQSWLVICIYFA